MLEATFVVVVVSPDVPARARIQLVSGDGLVPDDDDRKYPSGGMDGGYMAACCWVK
jgi:hypothetical protein